MSVRIQNGWVYVFSHLRQIYRPRYTVAEFEKWCDLDKQLAAGKITAQEFDAGLVGLSRGRGAPAFDPNAKFEETAGFPILSPEHQSDART